jgi:hypothetical protein
MKWQWGGGQDIKEESDDWEKGKEEKLESNTERTSPSKHSATYLQCLGCDTPSHCKHVNAFPIKYNNHCHKTNSIF